MRSISICHASRSRPVQAAQTALKWLNSASNRFNIEYIMVIDESDPMKHLYYQHVSKHVSIREFDNHSAIEAFNIGAFQSEGDIIVCVSDDFDCPDKWDEKLLFAIGDRTDFLAKTDDGQQPWIVTLPIMDQVYFDRFMYVYNPAYAHLFCDTELTHVADLLGKKITLPITFAHNHHTTGKTAKDALNDRNNATWVQGEEIYLAGVGNNFGLHHDQIKGHLSCDKGHIDWLKSKGIQIEMI